MEKGKIAITHASGLLAEALLERMVKSGIESNRVILLDNEQHVGNRLAYGSSYLTIDDQHEHDYEGLAAVLLLGHDAELEGLLKYADCYVISHLALDSNGTLFTPGVTTPPQQPCAIRLASAELAILLPVVQAIHEDYGLNRLAVTNILTAASYGKAGVEELATQTVSLLSTGEAKNSIFPLQLAFNMIPAECQSELELRLAEAMQIEDLRCSVQNILVPVFHGMALSVVLETTAEIDIELLEKRLKKLAGVKFAEYPVSSLTHCKTGRDVFITGLCQPQKDAKRLQFWIMADTVRNGLIQNYLNALEVLLKSYL